MKKIRCIISTAALIGIEVAALFYGQAWALHILQFFSPIFALCYLVIGMADNSNKEKQKILKTYRDGERLPKWLDLLSYCFVAGAFAALSHYWLAACWMLICGVDFNMRDAARNQAN